MTALRRSLYRRTIRVPLQTGIRTVFLGTRAERRKQGKDLRRAVPRETHSDLQGHGSRNAIAILAESDPDRVPELVPERYKRMMENPFRLFAGRRRGDGSRSSTATDGWN